MEDKLDTINENLEKLTELLESQLTVSQSIIEALDEIESYVKMPVNLGEIVSELKDINNAINNSNRFLNDIAIYTSEQS